MTTNNSTIISLNQSDSHSDLERLQIALREVAQERLDNGNYSLPLLPNAADSDGIRLLNRILTSEQIKEILEMIVSDSFSKDIVILFLSKLPQPLLTDFLALRSEPLNINYSEFINLLLYCSGCGTLDLEGTIAYLNELLVNITEPNLTPLDFQERVEEANTNADNAIDNNNHSNSALNVRLNSLNLFNVN